MKTNAEKTCEIYACQTAARNKSQELINFALIGEQNRVSFTLTGPELQHLLAVHAEAGALTAWKYLNGELVL